MKHRWHGMPFGAEPGSDGQWRFRLWAPAAHSVDLVLTGSDGQEQTRPMTAEDDGWFAHTASANTGDRYRYRIDGGQLVPDPASRYQPDDVHGPSELVHPEAWSWQDGDWRGRPWEEAVIYELHVGSFSEEGTFKGAISHLPALVELGVTAIELMPVADFPGARNWGYDGVFLFAPESHYGRPEDLKSLVESAHGLGLMVILDVVYNHFGPEGNYLHLYAPQFFTERHHTPWGAAINFDGEGCRWVREFCIHNALYWLEEYHLDGLRLDAVHAIMDDSKPDILEELVHRIRGQFGAQHIHLLLENDKNAAHYLGPSGDRRTPYYDAQWNDDIHHAFHVLATGEESGYYADYRDPLPLLGRALAEGFVYQGEASGYRHGETRGEPSASLPPTAFVSFLQNHDQIGNRACGDRLSTLTTPRILRALTAILLLAPAPPMLFMGQEWGTQRPFPFFCDFDAELGAKVTEGRRAEFARFPQFSEPKARASIPDPQSLKTFQMGVLDWNERDQDEHAEWLSFHTHLLALRHREIVPRLGAATGNSGRWTLFADTGLMVQWQLGEEALLLLANLGSEPIDDLALPSGELLFAEPAQLSADWDLGTFSAWGVAWLLISGEGNTPLSVNGQPIELVHGT